MITVIGCHAGHITNRLQNVSDELVLLVTVERNLCTETRSQLDACMWQF